MIQLAAKATECAVFTKQKNVFLKRLRKLHASISLECIQETNHGLPKTTGKS